MKSLSRTVVFVDWVTRKLHPGGRREEAKGALYYLDPSDYARLVAVPIER